MLSSEEGKILVTGGAGYIGSHTVMALREAGYLVVVVDNLSTGRSELLPVDVPLIIGDVADQELISTVIRENGCYGVMHFAGSIIVSESVSDPLKYYSNNTVASSSLIAGCVDAGVNTFVFASSAAVYGNPSELPLSEAADTHPVTPYGSSKLMTEWMLRDVSATSDFCYAALRYFNVAGADPKGRSGQVGPNSTHLIRAACELAIGKRPEISIFGDDYDTPDGTCIRDYIHVSDLATAQVQVLTHLLAKRESLILNCGYGHGFSVKEVLNMVAEIADRPLKIQTEGRRDGDTAALVSDSRKIRELLGWQPKHDDPRVIIETALNWERHQHSGDL